MKPNIEDIRKRCEAATEDMTHYDRYFEVYDGPDLKVLKTMREVESYLPQKVALHCQPRYIGVSQVDHDKVSLMYSDALFIESSKKDVSALLEYIGRLEGLVDVANDLIQERTSVGGQWYTDTWLKALNEVMRD